MVFHWSLNDSKSPQVSRTLLWILTDLNNLVVWMVFTRLLISKSSSLFNNPLVTVPRAPITIDINVTFMFDNFYLFQSFSHQRELMVFHRSFSDSKSWHISRTLLSILAALNYAVVLMVSTHTLISKPSNPFINLLVTVPSVLTTIGITVTFIFHNFFTSLARFR